ncbi:indolepyruvate ferredoxin oxidoreductase family protein [Pseudonocardia pini]|uniref:indolepyruvate ferredoxin oxidoreductase family protein n=1 Tax=Pseudonocardia pini TaxID=2758030 RepID=UPI0015F0BA71|nr:indolepyruvate ferredoxin oxidoreductase family protein [Pseudonocardia pini]
MTALTDRYLLDTGTVHLTGVQALARLPLDVRRSDRRAGRDTGVFVSGYEGSPLAGYDLELARQRALLAEEEIVFRPAVNEELAATAVAGTQLAATREDKTVSGVAAFWYGKTPGLDRAADALRHANLQGTHPEGGAVVLVGDDPGAKSSTVPGTSERTLADLGMPVLSPADPQEVLDLGLHAVAMSRASGLYVGLKIATQVADGAGLVRVDPDRVVPVMPDGGFRHTVTAQLAQPVIGRLEESLSGVRLATALRYAQLNRLNRITGAPDAQVGIVCAGTTALAVEQALEKLGARARVLRLGMVSPLDPEIVAEFAAGLTEIVVVEEKRPLVETAVKEILYGQQGAPRVSGKKDPEGRALLSHSGELGADAIARALARRLGLEAPAAPSRIALPLVTRTPYFCSGCPHNSSTKVPDGTLVGGGIGCHAMVLLMDPTQVGDVTGLTQMGGEGAQWIGMSPFLKTGHLVQNLGDGTFHHSGSLAIRGAVAAKVNVTYKLLHNSAVAMTGGQQPEGRMDLPALTRWLLAEGVARVVVTTEDTTRFRRVRLAPGVKVRPREDLIAVQEELAAVPGVTVLIHDQECATELRRKRKRGTVAPVTEKIVINERVCEGCGDCGAKSNCLSVQPVETEFGRKTRIDQPSCNSDLSCLQGDCPSFLTVRPGTVARRSLPADPGPLPDPVAVVPTDRHVLRIAGVGGSGVVTLSQILGVAGMLAGRTVSTLDQTGLAQKGGAVIADVAISEGPWEREPKASPGEVDCYLGADVLVAADPMHLAAVSGDRTRAVVSTAEVPTGRMVSDVDATFPELASLTGRISEATKDAVYVDARARSRALFGDDQYANLYLAGQAVQRGSLPLPAEAIEEAIELNGVAVEANRLAFRIGRAEALRPAVLDPPPDARTAPSLTPSARAGRSFSAARVRELVGAAEGSELDRLLQIRVPDLVGYQNVRYARRYAEVVARVARAEESAVPGSTALTEEVARQLHTLMAYKDEYEVARLSLDPALDAEIAEKYGAGAKVSYRLHPPVLRALGMTRKISLGPWFRPVFRLLAALRRVRGTRLDLFGYAGVRRLERDLVREYVEVVDSLVAALSADRLALAVRIAALPDAVRGYEEIKVRNAAAYRAELATLRARLTEPAPVD